METNKVYVVTETSNVQAHVETWTAAMILGVTTDFNKAVDIAMEYVEKESSVGTGIFNYYYINTEMLKLEEDSSTEIRKELNKSLEDEYICVSFSNYEDEDDQCLWHVRITEIEMDKLYESEI